MLLCACNAPDCDCDNEAPLVTSTHDNAESQLANLSSATATVPPTLDGHLLALGRYTQPQSMNVASIAGDFFGDQVADSAFFMQDSTGVKLCIINRGPNDSVAILGANAQPFNIESYDWVGVFESIAAGTPLWSNYTDDFRDFADVPQNEIVTLPHDAIFVHAAESCGGGFVYWNNNKWNWLQQE